MLEMIFNHQEELMLKYHEIEQKNLGRSLPHPQYIDLDSVDGQLRMKEFAWRITEELAEATECLHPITTDEVHYLEELVDALHFSVEFNVMAGIEPESFFDEKNKEDKLVRLFQIQSVTPVNLNLAIHHESIRRKTWDAVERLGVAMNTLKNKPWKSTHMLTDKSEFNKQVISFNRRLFYLMWLSGFTPKSLAQCYLNKNAVNKFRIRTNY